MNKFTTLDVEELANLIQEFGKVLHDIYGFYLDGTVSFIRYAQFLEDIQQSASKVMNLGAEEFDSLPFGYFESEEKRDKGAWEHLTQQKNVKERNRKDGGNSLKLGNYCVVLIYQYWEDHYRGQFAKALGLKKTDLKWDLMGDLNKFRRSIIHNKSFGVPEIKKCEVFAWFQPEEAIVINENRFKEILDKIKTSLPLMLQKHLPPSVL